MNLNADAMDMPNPGKVDEDGRPARMRSIGLYSMGQDTFEMEPSEGSQWDLLDSTLDSLHTMLNNLVADVITSRAASAVSLTKSEKDA